MKTFEISAIGKNGEELKFRRLAPDEDALRRLLQSEGIIAIGIKVSAERKKARRYTCRSAETDLRQLSSLLKSGVSLVWALDTLASRPRSDVWRFLHSKVLEGARLADSMRETGGAFDELTCTLAEVGENSGELDKSLRRASEQLEARRELRTMVLNALAYPVLAVLMAVGVAAFLAGSVIPKISDFLVSTGAELPPMTRLLLDISSFLRNNSPAMAVGILALAAAWWSLGRFAKTRDMEDAFLLRLPITGKILRLSGTALASRAMEMMLASGVTLMAALGAVRHLPSNRRFRRRLLEAEDLVERGSTLAEALSGAKEFPELFRNIASVGEKTGNLAEAFGEAAYFHEGALRQAVKRFAMLIEPVMILVTALIVGFVYVAFFMALFSLSAAA